MSEDEARRRLLRLTGARVFGLLLILPGLILVARQPPSRTGSAAGIALALTGLLVLWLLPRALLRRWRERDG